MVEIYAYELGIVYTEHVRDEVLLEQHYFGWSEPLYGRLKQHD